MKIMNAKYLFCFTLVHICTAEIVFVSQQKKWIEAREACKDYGGHLATLDVNNKRDVQLVQSCMKTGHAWFGNYSIASPPIAVLGCFEEAAIATNSYTVDQTSASACERKCNGFVFGVKENSCKCLQHPPDQVSAFSPWRCNITCDQYATCGGQSSFTVYHSRRNSEDNIKGQLNYCGRHRCFATSGGNKAFELDNCDHNYEYSCDNNVTETQPSTWSAAKTNCFVHEDSYLSPELLCPQRPGRYWNGYFTSEEFVFDAWDKPTVFLSSDRYTGGYTVGNRVLLATRSGASKTVVSNSITTGIPVGTQKHYNLSDNPQRVVAISYNAITNSVTLLLPTGVDEDVALNYFCKIGNIKPGTPNVTYCNASDVDISVQTTDASSVNTRLSTKEPKPETTKRLQGRPKEETTETSNSTNVINRNPQNLDVSEDIIEGVGVATSVTVAGLSIIVLMAVVLVVYRKRRQSRNTKNRADNDSRISPERNNAHDRHQTAYSFASNDYTVKQSTPSDGRVFEKKIAEPVYNDTDEGTYDELHSKQNRKQHEETNNYYSHTKILKNPEGEENLYDSSTRDDGRKSDIGDNEYSGFGSHQPNNAATTDDSYSGFESQNAKKSAINDDEYPALELKNIE